MINLNKYDVRITHIWKYYSFYMIDIQLELTNQLCYVRLKQFM